MKIEVDTDGFCYLKEKRSWKGYTRTLDVVDKKLQRIEKNNWRERVKGSHEKRQKDRTKKI